MKSLFSLRLNSKRKLHGFFPVNSTILFGCQTLEVLVFINLPFLPNSLFLINHTELTNATSVPNRVLVNE